MMTHWRKNDGILRNLFLIVLQNVIPVAARERLTSNHAFARDVRMDLFGQVHTISLNEINSFLSLNEINSMS